MADRETPRLYSDLAWLRPLWGDPDGSYAEWCAHVVEMIEKHARREVKTLLNLGCGGGKNAATRAARESLGRTPGLPAFSWLACVRRA